MTKRFIFNTKKMKQFNNSLNLLVSLCKDSTFSTIETGCCLARNNKISYD